MSVLKIKDKDGNWVGITSIKGDKGDPGDSPYDAAKKGGFIGTEERFNELLAMVSEIPILDESLDVFANDLADHIYESNPHNVTAAQIGAATTAQIAEECGRIDEIARRLSVGSVYLDSVTANYVFGELCDINRAFELIDARIKELEGK